MKKKRAKRAVKSLLFKSRSGKKVSLPDSLTIPHGGHNKGGGSQVNDLTESNRQLREELTQAKSGFNHLTNWESQKVRELREALAAAKEALEKVKLKGHLGNHGHWDSSMRGGAGCPLCIDQNTVRAEVNSALALIAECEKETP